MKKQFVLVFQKATSILCVAALFAVATTAHATTHVVQFGGSFGFTYSPSTFSAFVGDTIQWEGDFTMHPLSSTSVPSGAVSFHQASGSVFAYPVKVAGSYLYQCDFHFSIGMTASFTASAATGIGSDRISSQPAVFKLGQNFPNPFNPTTTISFDIPIQSHVSIKVFNVVGQEVATVVSENMAAGHYSKTWNAASMASGVYFYMLKSRSYADTKRLVLIK